MLRREELRELLCDLHRLPPDQRGALVLTELGSLSHAEVAEALGLPQQKVKALIFQARASLLASRAARDTACEEIRAQLAAGRGGQLRRALLSRHLRDCEGCRAFRRDLQRQRRQLALVLPVLPAAALREAVVAATAGTGAGTTLAGGAMAASWLAGGLLKALATALAACVMAAGTLVAVHGLHAGERLALLPTTPRPGASGRAPAHRRLLPAPSGWRSAAAASASAKDPPKPLAAAAAVNVPASEGGRSPLAGGAAPSGSGAGARGKDPPSSGAGGAAATRQATQQLPGHPPAANPGGAEGSGLADLAAGASGPLAAHQAGLPDGQTGQIPSAGGMLPTEAPPAPTYLPAAPTSAPAAPRGTGAPAVPVSGLGAAVAGDSAASAEAARAP